jgi:uncharacterized protein
MVDATASLMSHAQALLSSYTAADFIFLGYFVIITPIFSLRAGRILARTPRNHRNLVPRYWQIVARGLLSALVVLLIWRSAGRPFSVLGLDIPIGFRGQIGFIIVAVLACYYANGIFLRNLSTDRLETVRERLERYRILPETRGEFLVYPLVALVGSTSEELLYRGYLIWLLTPFAGIWGAAALSSFLFGLGHAYQGASGVLRTTLIGFMFALGFVLTHSLWWLMAAHIIVNLFGGAFAWKIQRQSPAAA